MFLSRLKPTLFRISTKLTLAYSLVLILGCTVIFSYLYIQIRQGFIKQEQAALSTKLEEIMPLLQTHGLEKFEATYGSSLQFLQDSGVLLMVVSPRADTLAIHEPQVPLRVDLENLKMESINQKEQHFDFVTEKSADFESLIVAGMTLPDETRLVLARNMDNFSEPLNNIREMFWWMLLPVALIGFVGGLFLSSRTLIPVRELIVSMKKIESGSLSTRVPVTGNDDELEELKVLCNRMLDKIESLVNGLKEAFDHLAHDIRTPVTRLRGRAELALMAEGDVESYREALQSCYENSDKILSFLQVLTDITEAENRSRKLKLEKKYISDLVREIMDLYEMAFEEKNTKVTLKLDSNDWAMVDARLISRVIANLLDNAHKYTPDGGEVTIQTINQTENVILRVTDTGPGIAGEEHSMIWQKLYRSDKSRSEYGMGLGLTFVKAVVEAHDGKVSVRSPVKDGKGTEFEVLLQKMS
ncbi:two-component sensor histidine kinase [Bdellovibrio bacteriovorus]|uniref:histidine kinase n=1 Tax=Bdellovibrio bacteriovorus TaxID=959 RepID=A0A150WPE4_BDEBC|nr:ATP-binding protein [Bdellovibrio bacteriovorus]KYG66194.1 two-component sensor histidine kinase [Bdellovibrio bacteriovorus]